jgi:3'-phosphoadenosine 5'-phosphosulfate sulfotransferase (PAPS reductase)/FAD synthetase
VKHIVGFSGGIDSQACARWVLNRFPAEDVILMNSGAGRHESPLTTAFVEDYSRLVHPVVVVTPLVKDLWKTENYAAQRGIDGDEELTFTRLIQIKGIAPSRKKQFCTDHLKLNPQRRVLAEMFGPGGAHAGEEYERYSGVRRNESQARKDQLARQWDDLYDCHLNAPLMDWTKKMCFDYVEAHGEVYNPLYKLGFNRVGCAPCINSGKDDILLWLQRFPDQIDKIRDMEKATDRTFFAPCVPGLRTNTIDDVVRWAQTDHGGRQANILRVINDRPSCESKYGLCE